MYGLHVLVTGTLLLEPRAFICRTCVPKQNNDIHDLNNRMAHAKNVCVCKSTCTVHRCV